MAKKNESLHPVPSGVGERFGTAVGRFGLELEVVRRNSLFQDEQVTVQELDLTQVVFDPSIGSTGGSRADCLPATAIDVAGQSRTDENATMRWRLSDFLCGRRNVRRPVSFVATAAEKEPFVVTASVVSVGADLLVDVFTWTSAGDPAPRTLFSWRCWAETFVIVE